MFLELKGHEHVYTQALSLPIADPRLIIIIKVH